MELKIEQLRQELIQILNNSNLPLSLISYILRDTVTEVDSLRAQELQQEKNALKSQESVSQEIDFDSEIDI